MKHLYLRLLLALSGFLLFHVADAQISVTATAGTTGPTPYPTLKTAFDAVNAGTHQGNISILVTSNTTETAPAILNASGSGSASYTALSVKPAAGTTPTISGNLSSNAIIRLNGSNNVTIDGSNNGTTSRDLTVTNTSTTSTNVLLIGSAGTTAINNVTTKNCTLINGTNSSTAVIVGDGAVAGSPGYFSNITLRNNAIQKAYIGIYMYAVVSALNNNSLVTQNDLDASGANALRMVGIYAQGVDGLTVSNNSIGNFETASSEFDRALWLATATKNTTVSGNTISGLAYTGTSSYAPIGINVSSGITNSNISVTNNIVSDLSSSGTGTTMGMFLYSAMSGVTVNANKVSAIRNTNTTGYGAAGILLATTTNTSATRLSNNFIWDVTGFGFNGYSSQDNGNGIVVDGGGGFNIDFNTVVLNAEQSLTGGHRASCLLITSNVTGSSVVNVRNNILANRQTVGNANSRLTLSNLGTAGSGVFGSINYNDYYAVSGNLSSTGTNASITNTIAQLQTSLGGNANSVGIQPVFVSAADIHLNPPLNFSFDGLGNTLAGITTDIDGNTRNTTTPDIGADEFDPCLPAVTFPTQPQNAAVCEGLDTGFSIVATNTTLYQWQVNTGSGFNNITNNAIYSGATTASLHLTNPPLSYSGYTYRCRATIVTGCSPAFSAVRTLTVNPKPVAVITPASPTTFCPGGSVVLNANTGFSYQWQQGSTTLPTTTLSHNATAAGNYTVIITNTVTGCKDTSDPVAVIINPVINATQAINICNNQLPYTWNGQSIAAGGTGVATFTTPSLVTGCDSTTTLNLSVTGTVSATANIAICANLMPYTWNGQTLTTGGTAVATFTTLSSSGCDSTTTLNLTVKPLLSATTNLTICQNQMPYVWNGITVTSGGAAAATFTTLSLVNGCDSTTTLNLTINPNPVLTVTPVPLSICSGSAANIALSSSISGGSIAWTVAQTGATGATAGSGTNINQTLTASAAAPGKVVYIITATANSCASNIIRDTVTVNPIPATTLTPSSQAICSGNPTSIAVSSPVSGATFAWTVAQTNVTGGTAGNGNTIAQTLTATTAAPGTATYTVNATANSCPGGNATVIVTVTPVPATPGTITGSDAPCVGSSQTYSVPSVTGATGYIWTLPAGWTGTSTTNSITVTVGSSSGTISVRASNTCGNSALSGKPVTPLPILTPTVSISSNAPALLCSGTLVTFTAAATNGGTAPAYQWKVNNNNVGSNSNIFAYVPADGDTVSCMLTSTAPCLTGNPATSNKIVLQVTPSVTTSLNIFVEENHICAEEPVHFVATPTYGGTNPAYQWKVNNINSGTNSVNFTYTPANNDMVTCLMTSNALCASPVPVLSNEVPMSITLVTHPSLSLSASPAGHVQNGQPVTFTASPQQGGSSYQITWYKNGANITGASGPTWSGVAGTDFVHGSRIEARLKSFSPCARPDTAWSNRIQMSVGTTGIGNPAMPSDFRIYPNPATYMITVEGLHPGDELSVYDALGHRLIRQKITRSDNNQVDCSAWAQGIYWIRFVDKRGGQWQVPITKQ